MGRFDLRRKLHDLPKGDARQLALELRKIEARLDPLWGRSDELAVGARDALCRQRAEFRGLLGLDRRTLALADILEAKELLK
jgi:hypothetical protein